jgi:hypothetical protein
MDATIVDRLPNQADRNVLMAEAGYRVIAKLLVGYRGVNMEVAMDVAGAMLDTEMRRMLAQGWTNSDE